MTITDDKGNRSGFKPALLLGRQFFELDDTQLICTDAEGREIWRIPWAEIAEVAFVDHAFRRVRMSRFDFRPRGDKPMRSISCNSTAKNATADTEFIAFRAVAAAIAKRLSQISPDLQVTIGEYGRTALWMFIIGTISIACSLGISIGAIIGGRGEALIPAAVLMIFGLFLAWSNAQWRPKPRVPVRLFADSFAEMDDRA